MTHQPKQWFCNVSWESVVGLNRALCQSQKLEALTNADGLAAARKLWEKSIPTSMLLSDALKICHAAFALSPFVFNNGNTFASIGRALVEEQLKATPPVEAQILRTTIGHYVAGKCRRSEMLQVLEQLGPLLKNIEIAAAPTADNVQAPAAPAPMVVQMPQEQRA